MCYDKEPKRKQENIIDMKRIVAWTLAAMLLLAAFAACTGDGENPILPAETAEPFAAETPAPEEEDVEVIDVDPSEWETADTPALTEAALEIFQKAFSRLLGVNYTPVAYLGKQVVSGTVHTFLTRARVIYPGARETYALTYLYEERDGDVRIIDISRSAVQTGMDGDGYEQAEDPVLTEELRKGCEEALRVLA